MARPFLSAKGVPCKIKEGSSDAATDELKECNVGVGSKLGGVEAMLCHAKHCGKNVNFTRALHGGKFIQSMYLSL